jgi:membrane fusion protein (multidrug efflux system)
VPQIPFFYRWISLLGVIVCIGLGGQHALAQSTTTGAPQVTVAEVRSGKVPITYEYAARIEASREVEVRAQASGILLRRAFNEGAAVKAGDLLFEIDPQPYEAELAVQRARLKQAEARLSQTTRDASRTVRLFERGTVAEKSRDDALSEQELAAAEVAAAEAQVRLAELNLDYTKVTAPISGITGQEQVPEGSLIGTTADTSLLTRITQVDSVFVNFAVSESERSEVRALLEAQGLWETAGDLVSVHIEFGDGTRYSEVAKLDFASAGLDPETGTMRLRAVVSNPEHRLLPGQFVRAVVTGITLPDAIVVPKEAVMQGPQGQFVYTVDSEGNAEVRPVTLGRELRDGWVVQSGLNSGDRVITKGIVKVRPGAPVAVGGAAAQGATATDAGQ